MANTVKSFFHKNVFLVKRSFIWKLDPASAMEKASKRQRVPVGLLTIQSHSDTQSSRIQKYRLKRSEQFVCMSMHCEIRHCEETECCSWFNDIIQNRFSFPSSTHGFEIEDFCSSKEDEKVIMYQMQNIKCGLRSSGQVTLHFLLTFDWVGVFLVRKDQRVEVCSSLVKVMM